MAKDYYSTLGVSRNATKEEIKKAYKTQAKKFHPDLNQGNKDAEHKFKEINEAYSVLGDEKQKQHYDQFGTADTSGSQGFQGGQGGFDFHDFGFDMEDIFESFLGGQRRSRRGSRRGSDIRYDAEITLNEAATGAKKSVVIPRMERCTKCSGSGAKSDSDIIQCPDCRGTGIRQSTVRTPFGTMSTQTTCRRCSGQGRIIKEECPVCDGQGVVKKTRKIEVDIPAGVDTGSTLRLSGEGEASEGGSGDLYVVVHVTEHDVFARKGNDLFTEIEISFVTASLGGEIEVPTLEGKAKIKIPPGTENNTVFRLKGKGIPNLNSFGSGDEKVRVTIHVPRKLSKRQKELLREFDEESEEDKGFLGKIKKAFFL